MNNRLISQATLRIMGNIFPEIRNRNLRIIAIL